MLKKLPNRSAPKPEFLQQQDFGQVDVAPNIVLNSFVAYQNKTLGIYFTFKVLIEIGPLKLNVRGFQVCKINNTLRIHVPQYEKYMGKFPLCEISPELYDKILETLSTKSFIRWVGQGKELTKTPTNDDYKTKSEKIQSKLL